MRIQTLQRMNTDGTDEGDRLGSNQEAKSACPTAIVAEIVCGRQTPIIRVIREIRGEVLTGFFR
jgi:hypothetical protein